MSSVSVSRYGIHLKVSKSGLHFYKIDATEKFKNDDVSRSVDSEPLFLELHAQLVR